MKGATISVFGLRSGRFYFLESGHPNTHVKTSGSSASVYVNHVIGHESRTHKPSNVLSHLHLMPADTIQSNHLSVPCRTNQNHSELDDWTCTSATPSIVSSNSNADWMSTTSLSSSDGRDESVDVVTGTSDLSWFGLHLLDSYWQNSFLFSSPITTVPVMAPSTWVESAICFDSDEAAPLVEPSQL